MKLINLLKWTGGIGSDFFFFCRKVSIKNCNLKQVKSESGTDIITPVPIILSKNSSLTQLTLQSAWPCAVHSTMALEIKAFVAYALKLVHLCTVSNTKCWHLGVSVYVLVVSLFCADKLWGQRWPSGDTATGWRHHLLHLWHTQTCWCGQCLQWHTGNCFKSPLFCGMLWTLCGNSS